MPPLIHDVVGGIVKDTELAIDLLAAIPPSDEIQVRAYTLEGGRIGAVDDTGNQRVVVALPDGRVLVLRIAAAHVGWRVERADGARDDPNTDPTWSV